MMYCLVLGGREGIFAGTWRSEHPVCVRKSRTGGFVVLPFLLLSQACRLKVEVHQQQVFSVGFGSWAHDFLKYLNAGIRRHDRFSVSHQTGSNFQHVQPAHRSTSQQLCLGITTAKQTPRSLSQPSKTFDAPGQEGYGRGRALLPVSFGLGLIRPCWVVGREWRSR